MLSRTCILLAIVAALLFTSQLYAAEFIPLGDVPGGEFFSIATGVSDGGTVVPEPSSAVMIFAGVFGTVILCKCRRITHATPTATVLGLAIFASVASAQTATFFDLYDRLRSNGLPEDLVDRVLYVSDDLSTAIARDLSVDPIPLLAWREGTAPMPLGFGTFEEIRVSPTLSADGSIFAFSIEKDASTPLDYQVKIWTPEGGVEEINVATSDGIALVEVQRASADGSRIIGLGYVSSPSGFTPETLLWDVGGDVVSVGFQLGNSKLSSDGSTIGGGHDGALGRWRPATGFEEVANWGSGVDNVVSVSADGNAMVLDRSGVPRDSRRYLWTEDEGLVQLPGMKGTLNPVTLGGDVVYGGTNSEALVWDKSNGTRSLQQVLINEYGLGDALTGWTLGRVFGLTTDGAIWGSGTNPAGESTAYVVQFNAIPEPLSAGDYNGDGIVNGADFLVWQRGESPNPLSTEDLVLWQDKFGPEGDYNGNDIVNGADFLVWQRGESPNPLSTEDLVLWQINFGPEGDYNSDDRVDGNDMLAWQRGESPNSLSAQDLSLWQENFGPEGDLNGDGRVNGADFLTWQRGESPHPLSQSDLAEWGANFGAAASLSANSFQVPEPSIGIMLMLGMLILFIRRRAAVSKVIR